MNKSLMLRGVALLCTALATHALSQGIQTVELQPLGIFIKTQLGQVAMPPTWQSSVLPGTVIYVDRRQGPAGGCATVPAMCRIKNKYIVPTPDDIPKDKVNQPGTIDLGALNSAKSTDFDLSVLVGKFAPSLKVGSESQIDYKQSHFTSKGWGPAILTSASVLKNSKTLQDDLTLGVMDGLDRNNKRAWKYFGRGYLVTAVTYATDLEVATKSNFQLSGSLEQLNDGKCTEEKLESLLKGDQSEGGAAGSPANNAHPATPNNVGPATNDKTTLKKTTASDAKKEIDSDSSGTKTKILDNAPAPNVTVNICRVRQGVYTLHVKPGIPIAFSAIPIIFDPQTNQPKVEQGDLEALHKALEKPDNQ